MRKNSSKKYSSKTQEKNRKAPKHAKAQPKDCSSKKKELYFLENTKTWKSAFSKIIVPIKRTPYFLEGSETYRSTASKIIVPPPKKKELYFAKGLETWKSGASYSSKKSRKKETINNIS